MENMIGGERHRPKLLEVAREKMRVRHMAYRTELVYLQWIRRYIRFHSHQHPRDLGAAGLESFLSHLAIERKVSASTQNQALQALLFLYRHVLDIELPWLDSVTRANRPKRLPVVLTRSEVRAILDQLDGPHRLIASLLYGSGLRLLEALRLRVKDLVFDRRVIIVREGKGNKDRVALLPERLVAPLQAHLRRLQVWYESERRQGRPGVSLPHALRAHSARTHMAVVRSVTTCTSSRFSARSRRPCAKQN
jgi:integrase